MGRTLPTERFCTAANFLVNDQKELKKQQLWTKQDGACADFLSEPPPLLSIQLAGRRHSDQVLPRGAFVRFHSPAFRDQELVTSCLWFTPGGGGGVRSASEFR